MILWILIIGKSDCIRKHSHRTYNNHCKHRKYRNRWIYPGDVTVVGNARVVGVLTVGSGSVTIDPGDNSISGVGTISITGGGSITGVSTLGITSAYFEIPTAPVSFPRNLVINGDHRICQRQAFGVTVNGSNYATDRFYVQANTAAHVVGMGSQEMDFPQESYSII